MQKETFKLVKLSNRQFNKVASVEAMLKVSADTRTAIVTKNLIIPPYGLPAFKCDSICFVHDLMFLVNVREICKREEELVPSYG